jgi:Cu(I)/Ag(I) efflux system membrane fusion protein
MIELRLRFVAVLVVAGLIVGYWDTLQNYWDHWTRPTAAASGALDDGMEFYCPMDPHIVRDRLEPSGAVPKCPICGMPLSKRKKGEPLKLPPGVVGRVQLSPDRVRLAGIRTEEAQIQPLTRDIRTVGVVAYDESRRSRLVTRVSGYLELLYVNKTFVEVGKGEPLAEIYSPELYTAAHELLIARQANRASMLSVSRDKLKLLGVDEREIEQILREGKADVRLTVRSPADGRVIEKKVVEGARVEAGQTLFEVADLSAVWIEADIYERDITAIHPDQAVEATLDAFPDQIFQGQVSLVYPEVNPATRTNRVRFTIDNAEGLLRPGMYATVRLTTPAQEIEPFRTRLAMLKSESADDSALRAAQKVCPVTGLKLGSMGEPVRASADGQPLYLCCVGCEPQLAERPDYFASRLRTVTDEGVLTVPERAVIDTGHQTIVYVERQPGVFEGVEVKLGPRSGGRYAVIEGLLPGDRVAAAGAFLVDAETRLNPTASAAYFGASGGPSSGHLRRRHD